MDTSTITIYADYQKLTVRSGVMRYASDTVNYVRADFEFGKGWEGFDAIQAVWKSKYETVSVVLDGDGCCMVPQEVLARRSRVQVNLVGFTANEDSLTARLTSYPAFVLDVDIKAELYGSTPEEITPTQFERFVGQVAETARLASESASNASESADRAQTSASSAATSEISALNSMTAASDSELSASESALSASGSADRASESALDASNFADSAEASAQSASSDADRAEAAAGRITGMSATANTLAPGSEATASYSDGLLTLGIPQGIQGERGPQGIQGAKGETGDRGLKGDTGNGIASAVLNSDYTLTLTFTDGTTYTTPSIRGEKGEKGDGGGGGSVTVDTEMSVTSSNPVENNVIKSYVDMGLANKINVGDALCVVEFTYDSANDKYTASKSANQIYEAWTNGKYVIGQISRENNYAFPILRGIGYEESNGENYPIAQFVLDENQITSNYTMAYSQLVIMMHRVGPGIDDDEIRYTQRGADAVPTSRKVNGKILYNDITLTAADVGALPSSTVIPTYTAGTGIDITNGVISIDLDNAEGSNY